MSQTTISASTFSLGLPAASALTGTERIAVDQGTYPNAITVFTTAAAIAALASGGGFANPTALVGLTAVNGVATTAMRSDAAPALSQAITPVWTGQHQFAPSASGGYAVTITGKGQAALQITAAANNYGLLLNGNSTSGESYGAYIQAGTTSGDFALGVYGLTSSHIFQQLNGDGSGQMGWNATAAAKMMNWSAAGNFFIAAPSSGTTLTVNGTINGADLQDWKDGTNTVALFTATGSAAFGTLNSASLQLWANNAARLTINTAGTVTIAAPSSGVTLTVNTNANLTGIQVANDGINNSDILVSTTTAGDAYYRATTFGVGNWAWGNRRSDGSFVLSNAADLSVPVLAAASATGTVANVTLYGTNNSGYYTAYINTGTGASDRGLAVATPDASATRLLLSCVYPGNYFPLSIYADGHGLLGWNGTANTITFSAAGNVIIAAPSSGDALKVAPSVTTGALIATSAALTSGAGAAAGTLTNAPSAGNPTKWIKINDNGTIRSIPAW